MNAWLKQTPKEESWNPIARGTSALSEPSKADAARQLKELSDEMKKEV